MDGMVKVTIGRKTSMHGASVGNEMGVKTGAAFAGSDEHAGDAVVDGDFAMREEELQLKAMRSAGINVVAIRQHMTRTKRRASFLHYRGEGKASELAGSVRKALDGQHAFANACVDAAAGRRRHCARHGTALVACVDASSRPPPPLRATRNGISGAPLAGREAKGSRCYVPRTADPTRRRTTGLAPGV
jgi:hypothetical protein